MEIGDTTTGDILEFHQISKTKLETEMEIGDATTGEDNVPDDNDDALNSIATLYDSFSDEDSEPNPDVHPEPFHILVTTPTSNGFDYADVEDPLTSIALLYASDDEDLFGGSAVMSIASNFTSGSSSGVSANGSIDEIGSDVDQNFAALNNIALLYATDDENISGGSAVPSIASNFTSGSSSGFSANGSIDEIGSDVYQNFAALNNIALLYATDDENISGGSAVPSIASNFTSESSSGVSANGSIDEIGSDVDQNFAALNNIALLYATDDENFSVGSAVPSIAFNSPSESSSGVSANGSIDEIDSDIDQNFAALNTIAILYATDGSSEDGDQNFASLNTIAVLYRSSSEEYPEHFSSGSDTIGALSDISPESDDIGIQHDMTFEETWERGCYLSSEDNK